MTDDGTADNSHIFYFLQINRSLSRLGFYFVLIVVTWYTLVITRSVFLTGMVGVSLTASGFLSSPISGALVDRLSKPGLVVLSTTGELFSYLALLSVIVYNVTSFYTIYVIVGIVYFMITVGGLSTYTITPELVPKDKLVFANSLTEISLTVSEGAGAILGGVSLFLFGSYYYVMLFAVFLLVGALFFTIPFREIHKRYKVQENDDKKPSGTWKETFGFVRSRLIPILVFSIALNSILVITDVLGAPLVMYSLNGNSTVYGIYVGSFSIGGLVGAIVIPRIRLREIWILILSYFAVTGVSLLIMGLINNVAVIVSLPFFIGMMASVSNIPLMSYLQQVIPTKILGKTTAFMDSIGAGLSPISATIMAFAGEVYGVNILFAIAGALLLFMTLLIPATDIRKIHLPP
ncbi:MAG: MFS transporter [Thermoplasmataceae archaeon]